jgi:uncharacterized cupredoxin-like copper-binding protein
MDTSQQPKIGRFLGAIAIGVLLTACAGPKTKNEETQSPASPSPAATQNAPVEVKLSEFKIEMPASIPAGVTAFKVTNVGKANHNFEIEGNNIEKKFDTILKPGETNTLEVQLSPGEYEVYCPIGNHEAMGMALKLTVKES